MKERTTSILVKILIPSSLDVRIFTQINTNESAPAIKNKQLRIFLCHSAGDKPAVRDLYRRLKIDGFLPWLDEEDLIAGQAWQKAIADAVRACEVVLICLSKDSITKSGFVQKEITVALDVADQQPEGTIFLIPARLEDVEVPERLGRWHWVNLFQENGYQRLLLALNVRAGASNMKALSSPDSSDNRISPINISDRKLETILIEYETKRKLLEGYRNTCTFLVSELLRLKHIRALSITSRVKDRKALLEKLTMEGRNYSRLGDVTDVVGIRVITHSESEVDEIGALVVEEFIVDPVNSVDRHRKLDPDRVGYSSLQYVCSLSPSRLSLTENRQFQNLLCEIQIRSVLQNAWAEIEHDLGYRNSHGFPSGIKRRVSRVAGLLEIADQEFSALRNNLQEYESRLKNDVRTSPAEVGIDNISLKAMFDQSFLVREIDEQIAKGANATIKEDNVSILPILSNQLPFVGINTIEQLTEALKRQRELVIYQATARLANTGIKTMNRGVSVAQLLWVLMGLQGGEEAIMRGIADAGLEGGQASVEFAKELLLLIREFQQKPK